MTDAQFAALLASLGALLTGVGAFLWRFMSTVLKSHEKHNEKLVTALDQLRTTMASFVNRLARIEGKMDLESTNGETKHGDHH